ncbi:uncharacterized protein [Rutidosis leptorrhynchoides]|uniref:uncharacterized protein n=1 Tax=Rutidosis leptorrhynchoides TaxID=125765 RepID=UPI003A98FB26
MRIDLRNGLIADFWHDPCLGDTPLYIRFPRLFALESNKVGSVASHFSISEWLWEWRRAIRGGVEQSQFDQLSSLLSSISFSTGPDRWRCDLSSDGTFYVSQARKIIDAKNHATFSVRTVWCNVVPIKINIFIWRLKLHRLGTLRNLESKELFFDISCCVLCDVSEESHNHLFVRCDTSYQIWCKVSRWIDIPIPLWNAVEEIWPWIDTFANQGSKKIIISIIVYSTLWNIWNLRNGIIFKENKVRKSQVFDSIVASSFYWLYSRYHKTKINWLEWLKDPLPSL